jgi:hypothetical protein
MKQKFTLVLLAISLSINVFAQTDKKEITNTFNAYKTTLDNLQLEKSMDFIYPKLYEFIPKEQIIAAFKKTFSDTNLKIKFNNIKLKSISEIISFNKVKYALISYSYSMSFTFSEDYSIEEFYTIYQQKYGKNNVQKNDKTRTINIKMDKMFYAINDPKYGDFWRFLEKNESQMKLLEMLIPKEIIEKL